MIEYKFGGHLVTFVLARDRHVCHNCGGEGYALYDTLNNCTGIKAEKVMVEEPDESDEMVDLLTEIRDSLKRIEDALAPKEREPIIIQLNDNRMGSLSERDTKMFKDIALRQTDAIKRAIRDYEERKSGR